MSIETEAKAVALQVDESQVTDQPMQPRYDGQNRRLCTAHTSSGEQCRAPAMSGQRVCRIHGGSTPQARAGAKLRLLAQVDPALEKLAYEMEHAEKSADRIRAADSILDRAGYGRQARVTYDDAKELLLERVWQLKHGTKDETDNRTTIGTEPRS